MKSPKARRNVGEMRHGRKSRRQRIDRYKRHVLRDLDSGLIRAVGVTPANAPEASVTDAIQADLAPNRFVWENSTLIARI